MNWLSGPFMDWSRSFYGGYCIGFGIVAIVVVLPVLLAVFREPKKKRL